MNEGCSDEKTVLPKSQRLTWLLPPRLITLSIDHSILMPSSHSGLRSSPGFFFTGVIWLSRRTCNSAGGPSASRTWMQKSFSWAFSQQTACHLELSKNICLQPEKNQLIRLVRIKSFILRYLDREKEYLGAKSPKFLLESIGSLLIRRALPKKRQKML